MALPPLAPDPKAIRLLKVNRDAENGYISCNTHDRILSKPDPGAVSYVALSYVWGKESSTFGILVNGKPQFTKQSLYSFLHYVASGTDQLAQELYDSYIWIDALCIDQQSNEEKGRQVPLMGLIFSEAQFVVGWLWSATSIHKSEDPNMQAVRLLTKKIADDPIDIEPARFDAFVERSAEDELTLATFIRLVEHPYWSRLWVVQEICLARRFVVVWEGQVFSWQKLKRQLKLANKWGKSHSPLLEQFEQQHGRIWQQLPIWALDYQTDAVETPEAGTVAPTSATGRLRIMNETLGMLVHLLENHHCTIPHDRVYALLALASDTRGFEVNYSESTLSLLVRLFNHYHVDPSAGFASLVPFEHTARQLDIDPRSPIAFPVVAELEWAESSIAYSKIYYETKTGPPFKDYFPLCEKCFGTVSRESDYILADYWELSGANDYVVFELPNARDTEERYDENGERYDYTQSKGVRYAVCQPETTDCGTIGRVHLDSDEHRLYQLRRESWLSHKENRCYISPGWWQGLHGLVASGWELKWSVSYICQS